MWDGENKIRTISNGRKQSAMDEKQSAMKSIILIVW
jgi:hypothetical protein